MQKNKSQFLFQIGIIATSMGLILLLSLTTFPPFHRATVVQAQSPCYTLEDEVLYLTNALRAQHGVNTLKRDPRLDIIAHNYAVKMGTQNFFNHDSPDGSTPDARIASAIGFVPPYWGENIAAGQTSASQVMTAWENSPGHLANLLFPNFLWIGIGYAGVIGSTYDEYWVQDFTLNSYAEYVPPPNPVPTPLPLPSSACSPGGGTPTPTPVPTPLPTGPAIVNITKAVDKPTAKPGDTLTYTLTAVNTGQINATNVYALDILPAGITYVPNSATGPGIIGVNVPNVNWDLGLMTPGLSETLVFKATVN